MGCAWGGPALSYLFFFFQAEAGIRYLTVTGVQTCALPISPAGRSEEAWPLVWAPPMSASGKKPPPVYGPASGRAAQWTPEDRGSAPGQWARRQVLPAQGSRRPPPPPLPRRGRAAWAWRSA